MFSGTFLKRTGYFIAYCAALMLAGHIVHQSLLGGSRLSPSEALGRAKKSALKTMEALCLGELLSVGVDHFHRPTREFNSYEIHLTLYFEKYNGVPVSFLVGPRYDFLLFEYQRGMLFPPSRGSVGNYCKQGERLLN